MTGLRRYCSKVIRDIELPRPFTAQALCDQIADRRGSTIRLKPLPRPTPPDCPTGMWLATKRGDYIYYDEQTSGLHRLHIILHEIGHMLCEHDEVGLEDNQYLYRHLDAGDPVWIRQVLPRIRYSSRQEQEAEMVATLLLERAGRLPVSSPLTGLWGRLEQALGFHRTR
ncbi:hypothetical protein SAMN05421504_11632 [Amycolatopsis xylanica]|uniref:IrrE N-terminal-like domain-containing protein n=1 Tax=Amycolatopsis xylanica TaxID=589385 RepID=A0A1H3SY47_9PSEU|nr:hypothetical protein [Amycolatopsis xylanica]SDZ42491.1 hypothetical protein SAMN05421504_11632 [Amycolatopsis xylanica]